MKARQKRLMWVLAGVALAGLAITLVLRALDANVMFFYSPSQVRAGEAPQGAAFRIGGLVQEGSVQRMGNGVQVQFVVSDGAQQVSVHYSGLLPDLFKEGKGVVASGKLQSSGVFEASEVLAKHDENYMPPEVAKALEDAAQAPKARP